MKQKLLLASMMLFLSLTLGSRAQAQQQVPLVEPQMIPETLPDSQPQQVKDPLAQDLPIRPQPSNFRSGDMVTLHEDEIIDEDFFAAGQKVMISGTVNGDVYAAGEEVTIDGTVTGDVFAAGGTVIVKGDVQHGVRLVGGDIVLESEFVPQAALVGGTIHQTSQSSVRSLLVVGGTADLDGTVKKNVVGVVGNMALGGYVGEDVDVRTDNFKIIGNGSYGGQLHEYKMDKGPRQQDSMRDVEKQKTAIHELFALLTAVNTLSLLALGLLLIYLIPNFMRATTQIMREQVWKSMGVGLLGLVMIPVLAVMMMVTLIGLPLGVMTIVLYGLLMYVAQFFVIFWLGQFIVGKLNKSWHDGYVFAVGLFAFTVLKLIPVLGWAVNMFAFFIAFGGHILAKKQLMTTLRKKKLI